MPSAVEECCEPSGNRQGISHCLQSGHPEYLWVIDVSGCLYVVELFSDRYSYSFCLVLAKFGTLDLCANVQKPMEQIFIKVLIVKKFF